MFSKKSIFRYSFYEMAIGIFSKEIRCRTYNRRMFRTDGDNRSVLTNTLFYDAVYNGGTQIYFRPQSDGLVHVTYEVSGDIYRATRLDSKLYTGVVEYLRYISGIDSSVIKCDEQADIVHEGVGTPGKVNLHGRFVLEIVSGKYDVTIKNINGVIQGPIRHQDEIHDL